MMDNFGKPNRIDYQDTGRYFTALIGPKKGHIGKAIKFLSWSGVILEFTDGTKITYGISDIEEEMQGPGEDAIHDWSGSKSVY
jgi:hypothetical protein